MGNVTEKEIKMKDEERKKLRQKICKLNKERR
jgi:hypothetical protein